MRREFAGEFSAASAGQADVEVLGRETARRAKPDDVAIAVVEPGGVDLGPVSGKALLDAELGCARSLRLEIRVPREVRRRAEALKKGRLLDPESSRGVHARVAEAAGALAQRDHRRPARNDRRAEAVGIRAAGLESQALEHEADLELEEEELLQLLPIGEGTDAPQDLFPLLTRAAFVDAHGVRGA